MWLKMLPLAAAGALTFAACRDRAPLDRRPPTAAPALPAAAEVTPDGQATPPIDLRGIGHDVGVPSAPVTVVEFADFGCPYCAEFARDVWPTVRKEYVETGKVRWKYVPFVMGMFPNGAEATRAAECAGAQGEPAFWAMYDRLFQRQPEWKMIRSPGGLFARYATDLHLDARAFGSCYAADARRGRVTAANDASSKLGVRVTPTFFVNGQRLEGALALADFRMVLQQSGAR
jgi:protein-disulfide isomerase